MKRFVALFLALACGLLISPRAQAQFTQSYNNLYYADSLNAGDSLTTAAVPCYGASSVTFFYGHADSLGTACGTDCYRFYSDSTAAVGLQFSNDGTYWGTGQSGTSVVPDLSAACACPATSGVTVGGFGVNNGIGGHPRSIGGPRICGVTATGAVATTAGVGGIQARFARFKMTNASLGRGSGACAACADVYKPFVRCEVTWTFGSVRQPNFTNP